MKKIIRVFVIICLLAMTLVSLVSCSKSDIVTKSQSNHEIDSAKKLNINNEIKTTKSYKVNNEIAVGNNTEIIKKQGTLDNKVYWRDSILNLGADSNANIRTFNLVTNDIESIDSNNNLTVMMNIMEGRKNHIKTIEMFGDIVAWSECPYANIDKEETNGKDWGLYFADLKTKEITKIDADKGITVPENTQYRYLAPNQVFISPDTISYISFDYNPDGNVTSTIKLYTISEQKLEIIDYLNEDLSRYAFGYPSVSGDKMVWCKALINPDGTYTGYSYLYDLKTKAKLKLVTDENIINPKITGNYIYAQGTPNKTFWDSEVCIYDISKNQWVFKINNGYSEYNKDLNVYLTDLKTAGNYLFWTSGVNHWYCSIRQPTNCIT